jgi:prevent-host-death family protein
MTITYDHGLVMKSRTIPAGQFKARCLKLMDEVDTRGTTITITKRGRPVARLAPVPRQRIPLRGALRGTLNITRDIIGPFHDVWGTKA